MHFKKINLQKMIIFTANSAITSTDVKQNLENLLKSISTCVTFLYKINYKHYVKNCLCVHFYFKMPLIEFLIVIF